MKVAIVHEWFTTLAGSEKVVEQIIKIYPNADIFCVYADPRLVNSTGFLKNKNIRTTFIQNLPGAAKHYRSYLPLMPLAIEQIDLSGYDVIISSSHAVAKGVLTGPDQLHVSYIHSPIRYAWDLQHQYLNESGLKSGLKSWIARLVLHKTRIWDYRTAAGVDHFVANSHFIGRRIRKVYRRDYEVIYPPVDIEAFELHTAKEDYYIAASRLVPYKKMELIVKAFSKMPNRKLVVIGDGPEMGKIKKAAAANIEILGHQPFNDLKERMQRARAFVFAAEEDFGITPVEAQACGTPVIAFGKGGALETVIEAKNEKEATGLFFKEQTEESLIDAVERFEELPFKISPHSCRIQAEKFSQSCFRSSLAKTVDEKWKALMSEIESPKKDFK